MGLGSILVTSLEPGCFCKDGFQIRPRPEVLGVRPSAGEFHREAIQPPNSRTITNIQEDLGSRKMDFSKTEDRGRGGFDPRPLTSSPVLDLTLYHPPTTGHRGDGFIILRQAHTHTSCMVHYFIILSGTWGLSLTPPKNTRTARIEDSSFSKCSTHPELGPQRAKASQHSIFSLWSIHDQMGWQVGGNVARLLGSHTEMSRSRKGHGS